MHESRDENIDPSTVPGVPFIPQLGEASVPSGSNESPLVHVDGAGIDSLVRRIIQDGGSANPSNPPLNFEPQELAGVGESTFERLMGAESAELKRAPQSAVVLSPNQVVEIRGLKFAVCDLDMTLLKTEEYHDGPRGRFAHSVRSTLEDLGNQFSDERWELYWEGDRAVGVHGLAAFTYPSIAAMSLDLDRRLLNVLEDVGHPLSPNIYEELKRVKDRLGAFGDGFIDNFDNGVVVRDLGAHIRDSLKQDGIKYSKIEWEWLWDGEAALVKHGFRSAAGQSEDDVFKSLVKMARYGLHIDLGSAQKIAGDEKLAGHESKGEERLRMRNEAFIQDRFESHHHLIEVIQGARELTNDVRASGGKLGLCTASGPQFVLKLLEIAEREEFGQGGPDGDEENKFGFLKCFDHVKANAAKRIGADRYNGDPVRGLCEIAKVDPQSAGMFGDGVNDFGAASEAGLPIVVLALNSESSKHTESANRILDKVDAAVRNSPGLVSKTTLLIVSSFSQVLIRDSVEGESGVRWKIATREELEAGQQG